MESKDTSGLYYKGKQYTTADTFKIKGTSTCSYKTYSSNSSAGSTKENYRATFYLTIGSNCRFSLYTYSWFTNAYTAVTTLPTNYYLSIRGPVVNQVVASPNSSIVLKQYAEGTNSFYFAYRTGTTPSYTTYQITTQVIFGKDAGVVTDHYFVLATNSNATVSANQLYYMTGRNFSSICYRDYTKLSDASASRTYYTTTFNTMSHTRTKYSSLVTLPISINTSVSNFCPTLYTPCITNAANTAYTATLV